MGLLSPTWLYVVTGTAFVSAIGVLAIGVHSTINQKKEKIGNKFSKSLYSTFYILGFITCIGFALARTNSILPMGATISCKIGFYLTINGVYLTKILLFIIFLYRIDLAFHLSAIGYHRGFLSCVIITYMVLISTLNALYCITCWPLINFQELGNNNHTVSGNSLGICTTLGGGTDKQQSRRKMLQALLALGDIIFSIFVCSLFVHKLRVVIKMAKEESVGAKKRKKSYEQKRDFKLILLNRKQTSLVILACVTTLLTLGISAAVSGFGLLIPFDVFINSFCVWLMFSFTKKYWNGFIKYVCCCFYCCVYKEDFIEKMHSLSKRVSMHSIHSDTRTSNYTKQQSIPHSPDVSVIASKTETNEKNIEIKFDNNIKSSDLKKNNLTINSGTVNTVKEESIDSPSPTPKSLDHEQDNIGYPNDNGLIPMKSNSKQTEMIQHNGDDNDEETP